ncbi:MAG: hypothetical protein JWO44_1894 [Bacteroidetes bacterium]|nr:hypothetical protein [Bacteroidota bacterium]
MKTIIRTVFICLIVGIPTGIYCQVKTEDESILQMLKQQTWKINHDLTTLKKGDSTFMWSNYGDKDIWKYLNKKEHQIIDGDFRFTDNGKDLATIVFLILNSPLTIGIIIYNYQDIIGRLKL